jgi:outer membrane lipoprotein-sorting protein
MRKLPGVESVDVSLERAMTDLRLRPGNTVTLDQLRKVIKNNGFNPKEADITVVGKISERDGQPVLSVTGTESVLILVADPKNAKAFEQIREHLKAQRGMPLEVRGNVVSGDRLAVRSITVNQ